MEISVTIKFYWNTATPEHSRAVWLLSSPSSGGRGKYSVDCYRKSLPSPGIDTRSHARREECRRKEVVDWGFAWGDGTGSRAGSRGRGGGTWRSGRCSQEVPWLGSVACRMEPVGEVSQWEGIDLLFSFFLLGKTCFPSRWHPVESWSAAAQGAKDLDAILPEVLKPKQTLFMKLAPFCVLNICSECHHRGVASAALRTPL